MTAISALLWFQKRVRSEQMIDPEEAPMFIGIEERLGGHSILQKDDESSSSGLNSLGINPDREGCHAST
ncbi:MAG: hypothetical protein WCP60_07850 [bacterium]